MSSRSNSSSSISANAPSRPVVKDGDWVCTESRCSNINDGARTSCERCGRSKPRSKSKISHEIGKDAAEKSKGLFSAEDWSCSKCGNINWSRRTQCNICNAPKFGEVEARTGYGGGYMDRQNVEYIQREESDEEYDEFGRKKKKDGGNNVNIGNSNNVAEKNSSATFAAVSATTESQNSDKSFNSRKRKLSEKSSDEDDDDRQATAHKKVEVEKDEDEKDEDSDDDDDHSTSDEDDERDSDEEGEDEEEEEDDDDDGDLSKYKLDDDDDL